VAKPFPICCLGDAHLPGARSHGFPAGAPLKRLKPELDNSPLQTAVITGTVALCTLLSRSLKKPANSAMLLLGCTGCHAGSCTTSTMPNTSYNPRSAQSRFRSRTTHARSVLFARVWQSGRHMQPNESLKPTADGIGCWLCCQLHHSWCLHSGGNGCSCGCHGSSAVLQLSRARYAECTARDRSRCPLETRPGYTADSCCKHQHQSSSGSNSQRVLVVWCPSVSLCSSRTAAAKWLCTCACLHSTRKLGKPNLSRLP